MKLLNLDHLARGTERQRQAHAVLTDFQLFEKLAPYTPVLAGTIPLDVDIPSSDLDVICSAENLEEFAEFVRTQFGAEEGFRMLHKAHRGAPTVICRFRHGGFQLELFTQRSSVFTQPAVLHMLVEARLLAFAEKDARERIRAMKLAGIKTEPAFAEAFAIPGDPYEELLKIAKLPDSEILHIAHRYLFRPQ